MQANEMYMQNCWNFTSIFTLTHLCSSQMLSVGNIMLLNKYLTNDDIPSKKPSGQRELPLEMMTIPSSHTCTTSL